ncbi:FAD-dependent monooxygenase [Actinopolymorpha alba]|uniref:FAD-dependent monooxygenase n=1 Tax=Actinopolymorpha alba TaxID=533267 RepID=UPI000372D6E2|nr:FAD-dependent monooxygenase [Actinopolymorpha alba]
MTTVLISGAGVAGSTLGYWLHRHGLTPTVVEQAAALRVGGQAIDVRGVALKVVDWLGILPKVRQARTRMRGMSVVDGDGNELMRSTETAFSSGRLDSDDVELLREDLTQLLYERTRSDVEYIFGDSISTLTEDENGVHVEFTHGHPRRFDLVVGADGLHSQVRRLAFGPEEHYLHHLGTYLAVFGLDNILDLDNWQVWFRDGTTGGVVYPVRDNTQLRVTLGFESEPLEYDYRDTAWQRQIVADKLANLRWEIPRLLKAMAEAPDFYFDTMAQIRMDAWTTGRMALIGDAGYCASTLSGQGTSLALVGAYVLADALRKAGGDHRTAFGCYVARMRPFVEVNQALVTANAGGPPSEESMTNAKNAITLDTPSN